MQLLLPFLSLLVSLIALSQADKYEWDLMAGRMTNIMAGSGPESGHVRRKRTYLGLTAQVIGITNAGIANGRWAYGELTATTPEDVLMLRQVTSLLLDMSVKLDNLQKSVLSVQMAQKWSDLVSQYSASVNRLSYFRHQLNKLQVSDTGTLYPVGAVNTFHKEVLDTAESAAYCLFNIHQMIMGTSVIFNGGSVLRLYLDTMQPDETIQSQKYFLQIFVNDLIGLQHAGYMAYFTALNLAGSEDMILDAQRQMRSALNAQDELINQVLDEASGFFGNTGSGNYIDFKDKGTRFSISPNSVPKSGPAPIHACRIIESAQNYNLECKLMELTDSSGDMTRPEIEDLNKVSNVLDIVHSQSLSTNPMRFYNKPTCVDDPTREVVCGVAFFLYSGVAALKIKVCDRTQGFAPIGWILPSGETSGNIDSAYRADAGFTEPKELGWVSCMGLHKNEKSSLAIALWTVYEHPKLQCDLGWLGPVTSDFKCFKLVTIPRKRGDAQASCLAMGSVLASLPTEEEVEFLLPKLLPGSTFQFWVHLNKLFGTWMWSTPEGTVNLDEDILGLNEGSSAVYTCGKLQSMNGQLHQVSADDCIKEYFYICQKPAAQWGV